jgi:hypothetical protein
MLTAKQRTERLAVLAVIGALALNYPLLSLFASSGLLFGIPILYLYLFALWGGLIALAGIIVEAKTAKESAVPSDRGEGDA